LEGQHDLKRDGGKAILTNIRPSSRREPLAGRYPQMPIILVFNIPWVAPQAPGEAKQ
jgi:hypothetical protein